MQRFTATDPDMSLMSFKWRWLVVLTHSADEIHPVRCSFCAASRDKRLHYTKSNQVISADWNQTELIIFCFVLWIDASVNSLLSLGSLSLSLFFFFFTNNLSLRHRLTGDIDLIPGMMLSNCRPETDLHNQTIGGKMGHVGKQLFLSVLAWFLNSMSTHTHTHTLVICFSQKWPHQCTGAAIWAVSAACFGRLSVMCACFLQAGVVILLLLLRLQVQINRTFILLLIHKYIYLFPWCNEPFAT